MNQSHLNELIKGLKQFRMELTESSVFPESSYILNFTKLNEHYRGFPIKAKSLKVFRTRATDYATDFENIKQLGPPPSKGIKLQRCNFENQSIFYASDSLDTSLIEVDFSEKPCAITGVFELKNRINLSLISIGEIDFFRRHNRTLMNTKGLEQEILKLKTTESHYNWLAINYIDSYLADLFSQESSNNQIYELTSRIANAIFATGKIDGIIYPSVKHNGGINFAFLPDIFVTKFNFRECYATNPITHLGYGLFEYTEHAKSFYLENDGNIRWIRDPRFPARSTIPVSAEWD